MPQVKSGVWDSNGVFIYTTLNHIKYVLPTPTGYVTMRLQGAIASVASSFLRDRRRCITDWLGWVSVAWRVGCCSDTGIVRTLDVPVYATECNDTTLHCLDRDGKTLTIMIDNSGTPQ